MFAGISFKRNDTGAFLVEQTYEVNIHNPVSAICNSPPDGVKGVLGKTDHLRERYVHGKQQTKHYSGGSQYMRHAFGRNDSI